MRVADVTAAHIAAAIGRHGVFERQDGFIIDGAKNGSFGVQAGAEKYLSIARHFRRQQCPEIGEFDGPVINIHLLPCQAGAISNPTRIVAAIDDIIRVATRLGQGIFVLIVPGIHRVAQAELPQIVDTLAAVGAFLGRRQRGQQHGGQDRDDGDYHEQFDQGKCLFSGTHGENIQFHF